MNYLRQRSAFPANPRYLHCACWWTGYTRKYKLLQRINSQRYPFGLCLLCGLINSWCTVPHFYMLPLRGVACVTLLLAVTAENCILSMNARLLYANQVVASPVLITPKQHQICCVENKLSIFKSLQLDGTTKSTYKFASFGDCSVEISKLLTIGERK